jgi:hypothetical protein
VSHVNVVPDSYFSTLLEVCDAEDHYRDLLAQSSALAHSPRDGKDLNGVKAQTDKNQVRRLETGLLNRFLFISRRTNLIAAGRKESFYPMTRLFHILNHKDDRTLLSIKCHGLFHQLTTLS